LITLPFYVPPILTAVAVGHAGDTIAVGPHGLTVDAPPDQPLAPGTHVSLAVDASHTCVGRD